MERSEQAILADGELAVLAAGHVSWFGGLRPQISTWVAAEVGDEREGRGVHSLHLLKFVSFTVSEDCAGKFWDSVDCSQPCKSDSVNASRLSIRVLRVGTHWPRG